MSTFPHCVFPRWTSAISEYSTVIFPVQDIFEKNLKFFPRKDGRSRTHKKAQAAQNAARKGLEGSRLFDFLLSNGF